MEENKDMKKEKGFCKQPSVTTGGKPYFWIRFTETQKQTLVWDRFDKQWIGEVEFLKYHYFTGQKPLHYKLDYPMSDKPRIESNENQKD